MSARDGNTASDWVPTGAVSVRVPGKVNLYLEVGDQRDDGYHELTTVFHAVSLLDEVTVTTADVLTLEVSGEGADSLPADKRNLAWQAAELLAEHVGRAPDVAISIEKTIPVAGGMAGGSADAAAVLAAAGVDSARVDAEYLAAHAAGVDRARREGASAKADIAGAKAEAEMNLDVESLAFELKSKQLAFDRQRLLAEDLQRQVDELIRQREEGTG